MTDRPILTQSRAEPCGETRLSRMGVREIAAYLRRASRAATRDRLEPCEHGHPECSDQVDGPCLDEALATPTGRRFVSRGLSLPG